MTLEIKLEGAQGSYNSNPSRDIAHFWQDLVGRAKDGLVKKNWEPWYEDYLRVNNVHEDQLLYTLACYCTFLELSLVTELDHPYKALVASGFTACPKAAQLVVVAKIGQLGTGAFWAGIRSATHAGQIPATIKNLGVWAEETRRVLSSAWTPLEKQKPHEGPTFPRATSISAGPGTA